SIIEAMGGEYTTKTAIDGQYPYGIQEGGKIIHEVGTARMGADPKTSVLNGYCQAHDVKNLFVTDGAPLVTNPDQNPTLTLLVLPGRACEYLLGEAQKGTISWPRMEFRGGPFCGRSPSGRSAARSCR